MTNQKTRPVCYLSGPIGKDTNAWQRFAVVRQVLTDAGWIVLDPTVLPEGLTHEQYMAIDTTMMAQAQVLVRLDGWQQSPGARIEDELAAYNGMPRLDKDAVICLDVSRETSRTITETARRFLRGLEAAE